MARNQKQKTEANLLPGINGVEEVLRHAPERIRSIYISEVRENDSRLKQLVSAGKHQSRSRVLSESEFDEKFDKLSSQGVVAELDGSGQSSLEDLLHGLQDSDGQPFFLVLDQISDVHNLGSLFRLAAAAGLTGLIIPKDNAARVSPAVRRVSMGATELVPWASVANLSRAIDELKKSDVWVYGATSHSALGDRETVSIYQSALPTPLALVLGSEEKGIRRLTEKSCDGLVKLPMSGKLESLNVAQAGAALVFEILRANGSHN